MSNLLKVTEAASLALHAMVLLAAGNGDPVTTREAASTFETSEAHLSKVLQRLAHAGLVKSVRGPGGGFLLARKAEDINLLQIYETIDGPLNDNDCLLGRELCGGEACILGDLLKDIHRQVRDYLARTTLPELTAVCDKVRERKERHVAEDR